MDGGLTQGAPESALLFNVAFIPLQAVLSGIRGYCMGKGLKGVEGYEEEMEERNIVTYSDDSNICCRMEKGSVGRVHEIVEGFCQVSDQIVNARKTKVFLSHAPSQEETEMLENLGLSREKFILPGQRIKIVGYEFRVDWNLRANSRETLETLTEELMNRTAGWNTVS